MRSRVVALGFACMSPFAAPNAQSADSALADVRTGFTAQRTIRAATASFQVRFSAIGMTAAEAHRRLAFRADTVRRALERTGVTADSIISTSLYWWWPERIQVTTKPKFEEVPGRGLIQRMDTTRYAGGWSVSPRPDSIFTANEIFDVHAGAPARVGPAFDALLAVGVREISNLRFQADLHDVERLRLELLREASVKATEQAAVIAEASGMRLARTVYVGTEQPNRGADYYSLLSATEASGYSGEVATRVTAPTVNVTMTVYGYWKMTPKR